MKRYNCSFLKPIVMALAIAITCSTPLYAQTDAEELPVISVLGKKFYCYETHKGESLFGIANRFGWDAAKLAEVNFDVTEPLEKGLLLYYPLSVEKNNKKTKVKRKGLPEDAILEHTVRPGETVSSIARTYGVATDDLYSLNPSARGGIVPGDKIQVRPAAAIADTAEQGDYVYHNVSKGENLEDIAKEYDTKVEDMYKANPGLGAEDPDEGTMVRVMPGTRLADTHVETVSRDSLQGMRTYHVKKGDTWAGVARRFNVDEMLLRQTNSSKHMLHKGDVLTIPVVEQVEVEQEYVVTDPREATPEGRRELYNMVHGLDDTTTVATEQPTVSVAIVLDDKDTNRDMEFVRGALIGIDALKNGDSKILFSVIDGTQGMTEIMGQLDHASPGLIVSTAEKNMPKYLSEYATRTGALLVNTFDVKNEDYLECPGIVQYLTPTSYFNESVADYLKQGFGDWKLTVVGNIEAGDQLLEAIMGKWDPQLVANASIDQLEEMPVDEFGKYLLYATPTRKDDVQDLTARILRIKEMNPLADIRVVARPNWITFAESMGDRLADLGTLLPTRFYFDQFSFSGKDFIEKYKANYGHTPLKSYPVYAVTGYDVMRYFIPNLQRMKGDANSGFTTEPTLQNPMGLERVSNWSGLVNDGCYIVEYLPFSERRKILLPLK